MTCGIRSKLRLRCLKRIQLRWNLFEGLLADVAGDDPGVRSLLFHQRQPQFPFNGLENGEPAQRGLSQVTKFVPGNPSTKGVRHRIPIATRWKAILNGSANQSFGVMTARP